MGEFNRMTIVAAAEVIASFNSHDDMRVLEVQWGTAGRYATSSKPARIAGLANVAIEEGIQVYSEDGLISLKRALIETAIRAPEIRRNEPSWKKLVAALRFDGFEIVETRTEIEPDYSWQDTKTATSIALVRMLPQDVPELDFREGESEVMLLLDRHGFTTSKGQPDASAWRASWPVRRGGRDVIT